MAVLAPRPHRIRRRQYLRHHLHQTFVSHPMNLFRVIGSAPSTIGAPQQQHTAKRCSPAVGCAESRYRRAGCPVSPRTTRPDTLQETTAETGGHQHVADANIGIRWQMSAA